MYELRIKGSESMIDTFKALVGDFEQIQDTLKVTIEGGGSRTGMMAIADGSADIGLSSFEFNLDSILGAEHSISELTVAYDGIVIVHSEQNPVESLTNEQVRHIYEGRITNWSELGGNEGIIAPIVRDQNSGTQRFFETYFDLNAVTPRAVTSSNNQEILANIFDNENAIGFIGYAYFSASIREVALPLPYAQDSSFYLPTPSNLFSGKYPLKRSLRIYFDIDSSAEVEAFLTYLKSKRAKNIIEGFGLIST